MPGRRQSRGLVGGSIFLTLGLYRRSWQPQHPICAICAASEAGSPSTLYVPSAQLQLAAPAPCMCHLRNYRWPGWRRESSTAQRQADTAGSPDTLYVSPAGSPDTLYVSTAQPSAGRHRMQPRHPLCVNCRIRPPVTLAAPMQRTNRSEAGKALQRAVHVFLHQLLSNRAPVVLCGDFTAPWQFR